MGDGVTKRDDKIDDEPSSLVFLREELENLGLSPYEARVLMGLLRSGSIAPPQLAQLAEVPPTSIYKVLEQLNTKGLAERLMGDTNTWASVGHDEVVGRLELRLRAANEERLRNHQVRAARVEQLLAKSLPATPSVSMPFVHLLHGAAQARDAYNRMIDQATGEILVFNRRPYSWPEGEINPAVVAALARGVRARALYEDAHLSEPDREALRQEHNAYFEAGVQARVVDELPMKLAIVDRRTALVSMADPRGDSAAYPNNLFVEHAGFAAAQAVVFEHYWGDARPYDNSSTTTTTTTKARH